MNLEKFVQSIKVYVKFEKLIDIFVENKKILTQIIHFLTNIYQNKLPENPCVLVQKSPGPNPAPGSGPRRPNPGFVITKPVDQMNGQRPKNGKHSLSVTIFAGKRISPQKSNCSIKIFLGKFVHMRLTMETFMCFSCWETLLKILLGTM